MSLSEYSILTSSHVRKDLKKIERSSKKSLQQILQIINSLPNDPLQGKPLKGSKQGCYSLRQGDYRIIYEIYHDRKIIHIIRVGHRKDVYR